ncbi:MAG: D-alanyl-D-alanine carboxypeptidase/D-alanyl-D-alanine-endopeptidase [Myxococcales bacterium]|nr:D-alanyl-D-alanine carboxypeptidase/D-alanyl-D-alanine-endopeptidase [Myxococcales bacterium]
MTRLRSIVLCLGSLTALTPSAARAEPADAAVRELLQAVLTSPELVGSRTGIHVRSLTDDRVVFEEASNELFNPASNMKLLTTAAALHYLGPSYVFRTEVRRDPTMVGGTVKGNLYIKGRGDPTLTTEALFGLVNEIALRGIREIEGNLVIDASFFDAVGEGPGWEEETGDPAYAAPIGALSVNFNTFVLRVLPADTLGATARVNVWPDVDVIQVKNEVVTRGPRTRTHVWVGTSPVKDRIEVVLRGFIGIDDSNGRSIRRRIYDPARFSGAMVKRLLELRGITVRGRAVNGLMPEHPTVAVTTHYSSPLADIVSLLNKYSNNFIAEQILKTLGAEMLEAPGSWEKGINMVSRFLVEIGAPAGSFRLGNGSGLNDVNRVTPALVTDVLAHMYRRFDLRPEFVASLAVAGQSGTIGSRFADTPAVSRIRAKTGTLTGVSTLSGYVVTRTEEVLAFSIMMNNYDGSARDIWRVQDRIGVVLSGHPEYGGREGTTVGAVPVVIPAEDSVNANFLDAAP